jgi:hypothetical protein
MLMLMLMLMLVLQSSLLITLLVTKHPGQKSRGHQLAMCRE